MTTAVETEGIGRTLSIYAKTDGSFYDTYANIVFNVLPHLPKVLSMEFSADTAVVNEYIDVTIVTNSHAEIIRIANENGLNMGKTLISKTILDNGDIQWVYSICFGTPGVNKLYIACAGDDGGFNYDDTASDTITVTAE